jgi:prepilin-type N-terminal cleavage/methylation domain-containing protein
MIKSLYEGKRSNERGLSLIEVLVTIAVVAIVAAISLPVVTGLIQRAQIDAHKSEMLLTASVIQNSIAGMGGVAAEGYNLGSASSEDPPVYKRFAAKDNVKLRFDRNNKEAYYTAQPSRITRLAVSPGNLGTEAAPYTGFCITAWVGDINLELYSGQTVVTEIPRDSAARICGDAFIPGPIAPPSAPEINSGDIDIDSETGSITLPFDAPSDIGGEHVDLTLVDSEIICTSSDGGATKTFTGVREDIAILEGLDPGKTYTCTVSAINNGDPARSTTSDPSEPFLTLAPPSSVTLGQPNPGVAFSLGWTFKNNEGDTTTNDEGVPYGLTPPIKYAPNTGYTVYYIEQRTPNPYTANSEIPGGAFAVSTGDADSSYVLEGRLDPVSGDLIKLEPGKTYCMWIRANNQVGEGSRSDAVCAQTGSKPEVPLNPLASNDLAGAINVTWNFPEANNGGVPLDSIEIQYALDGNSLTENIESDIRTFTKTASGGTLYGAGSGRINNLAAETSYFFRIRASNTLFETKGIGPGDWSAIFSGATAGTPAPPGEASVEVDDKGVATITWG